MKVNSIGIQSYQQIPRRDDKAAQIPFEQEQPNVTIQPKKDSVSSPLAVKAKTGNYADTLTTEERRAMELLFSRFKDSGRFGMNGKPEADNSDAGLGQIIDVKI